MRVNTPQLYHNGYYYKLLCSTNHNGICDRCLTGVVFNKKDNAE